MLIPHDPSSNLHEPDRGVSAADRLDIVIVEVHAADPAKPAASVGLPIESDRAARFNYLPE